NPRSAILVDYCYFALLFCRENKFSLPQTSAFFAIMLKVFTSFCDDKQSSEECLAQFKDLILAHSAPDSDAPEGGALFDLAAVKLVSSYVSTTFFRYSKAFSYVFDNANEQELLVEERKVDVETPLMPQKLDEAMTQQDVVVTEPLEEEGAEEGGAEEGGEEGGGGGGGEGEAVGEVFELG
ncbi:hypothetical protein TeGR_g5932, partial [Tetraparma gracilis]